MRIDVLTLFPEVFEPFISTSIVGRARQSGLVSIELFNIRDFSQDRHRKVDDKPFGGGPGMVMICQPAFDAVEQVEKRDPRPARRVLLTPQGARLDQDLAERLSRQERLLLIAGHYEGFDERIREGLQPLEVSIGDYVLSGGEVPAMVVIDAVVRLRPGALGDAESTAEESFRDSRLEYPQYTRPRVFRGMNVPEVLLSGDHAQIADWRKRQALGRTRSRRPDLLSPGRRNDGPETENPEDEGVPR